MPDRQFLDHFAQRITGSGRGAVAVIRFRCSQMSAEHPANGLFRSIGGKSLSECKLGKISYGDWRNEDVVVVRTNEHEWEVNCHGGPAPVKRILSDLQNAGIQSIDQQSQHTMTPAGEPASAKQQWQQLLLKSKTIATADLILSQPSALQKFSDRIQECQTSTEAIQLVNHFLSWKPFADHLVEPWIVAIVGKPNAGKSSFLNAIVGYQRSIVFDKPGTTRDLVQCDVVIGGWPIQLVDTAGIRNEGSDDIEQQGIKAAKKMIESADLCIVISDQSAGWTKEDRQLLDLANQRIPACVVHNKIDLPAAGVSCDLNNRSDEKASCHPPNDISVFHVCSTTADGIQPVVDWISTAAVPIAPAATEPLPILESLVTACQQFCRDADLPRFKNLAVSIANSIVAEN